MPKIELKLRDLRTGERAIAEIGSEPDAIAWLESRPEMMEVLGVSTPDLGGDVHRRLRAACRPYAAEERARIAELDAADEAAAQEALQREAEEQERELAAHREALRHADPSRPMEIYWSLDGEMALTDPCDEREITAVARAAVLAWVAERDEWVKERGLVVGEATVTVWPGTVPEGGERVQRGGQFSPVPARR